jgi:hypothetical protein
VSPIVSADRYRRDSSKTRMCPPPDIVTLPLDRARTGKAKVWQTAGTRRQLLPDPSLRLRSLGVSKDNDRDMQAVLQRDRSLQRISVLTRAIAVGSVALSAGFATLMALAQPARAKTGAARSSTVRRRATSAPSIDTPVTSPASVPKATAASPSTSDSSSGGYLAPPPQAPAYDSGGGSVVVSGQS